ncbi:polyprenyl synthetase [Streptomyces sp. V4-01]|uniref:Polyprenyl synthetase n=1 Tax=Actinacidiphila polyblastidii TaxID=3110430 RepID=A0ABU7P3W9_9ACTN|nr:polyprenyl synthetase [Streptomyces sp. V4-01]
MSQQAGRRAGLDGQAVLLVAGLADLAATTLGSGLATVRWLLRRSDAADLAADAEQDLVARGRLALDRYAAVPPAHLEILARHARTQQPPAGQSSSRTGAPRKGADDV